MPVPSTPDKSLLRVPFRLATPKNSSTGCCHHDFGGNGIHHAGTQIPGLGVLAHRPAATANAQPPTPTCPTSWLHQRHPRQRMAHAHRNQTRGAELDDVAGGYEDQWIEGDLTPRYAEPFVEFCLVRYWPQAMHKAKRSKWFPHNCLVRATFFVC